MKKVCLYGPESTGKSLLAKKLADIYHTQYVPEVAREFITSNNFAIDDIIRIGREQTARIKLKERTASRILFCDTDLITTQIYCRQYLGVVPPELYDLEKKVSYDQYFLFDIDVPWVADGLRDLGEKREQMFKIFKEELDNRKIKYVLVRGNYDQREKIVRREVDQLLASK